MFEISQCLFSWTFTFCAREDVRKYAMSLKKKRRRSLQTEERRFFGAHAPLEGTTEQRNSGIHGTFCFSRRPSDYLERFTLQNFCKKKGVETFSVCCFGMIWWHFWEGITLWWWHFQGEHLSWRVGVYKVVITCAKSLVEVQTISVPTHSHPFLGGGRKWWNSVCWVVSKETQPTTTGQWTDVFCLPTSFDFYLFFALKVRCHWVVCILVGWKTPVYVLVLLLPWILTTQ